MKSAFLRFTITSLALSITTIINVAAASAPVPRISARELQADFVVLKKAYEELHPGLYRYNNKARMDVAFKALESELNRDRTLQEAYLAFSIFLAKIKCGHSYANFYNQPKEIAGALFQGHDKLPFYFRWIGRRMIITRSFSEDERLQAGTEVLGIDGVSVDKILDRLMTVARADGSNDAKRVNYLEVSGESDYEAFDIFFPMFFPPSGPLFELRVRTNDRSKPETLEVSALTYDQRLAPVKVAIDKRRGGSERVWDFEFLDEQTAYLRMPTWALYNSKWGWKQFLEDSFDELVRNETANLVIDLRGNEGGESVGDVILGRLIKQDLRLESFERRVRYRKVSDELNPHLDTWDKSFRDWGAAATNPGNGFYTLTKYDDDSDGNVIKASDRPFRGRTFVLVDASNSSATFEFAQTLQQNKLGTLVGQSTGGNKRGINGGAFFFLRLPNSKIEIDLPLIGFFPKGDRPDAGLQPDVRVEPRVKDVASGVDTELTMLRKRL